MSKKFKVIAQIVTTLTMEIDAEDLEDAQNIAPELDGGDFTEVPNSASWYIYDVQEVESSEIGVNNE